MTDTALRLRLRDVSPKVLRIVLWSQDVGRQAKPPTPPTPITARPVAC